MNDIYKSWSKIKPDELSKKRMLDNINAYARRPQLSHRKRYKGFLIASAAILFVTLIAFPLVYDGNSEFILPRSSGNVTVKYVNEMNQTQLSTSSLLEWKSEEQIFRDYDTAIFKGTVKSIRNIEIYINGSIQHRALAKIKTDTIYRGELAPGETISVLLPSPITEGLWVEDMQIISRLEAGVTGIFMPIKYGETDKLTINGAELFLKDIAEYGIQDGVRFAFIETDRGVLFDRGTFRSLSADATLEDVEKYVIDMIE